MPISLRIPIEKELLLSKLSKKTGKTKTALILEAIDEKIGVVSDRKHTIRELAGWMSSDEAAELRKAVRVFDRVEEGDWE